MNLSEVSIERSISYGIEINAIHKKTVLGEDIYYINDREEYKSNTDSNGSYDNREKHCEVEYNEDYKEYLINSYIPVFNSENATDDQYMINCYTAVYAEQLLFVNEYRVSNQNVYC